MKPVTRSGEGNTTSLATYDDSKGPQIRVSEKPYYVNLKDVVPIKTEVTAGTSTSST